MAQFVTWLLALEIIGLAFLPLTIWLFRWLPDRGYVFAKLLGLVLITYITWLAGSAAPVAESAVVPVLALVVAGGAGWWMGGREVLVFVRERGRLIAIEEILFVAALLAWSLMRAYYFHPAISHTEQYMDMMFLNTSFHSASYPPADLWMSGHTVNYYYFGYLMFATLAKLSVVSPAIGYNLAISTIFALVLAGSYSIGYALTRSYGWALLAPLFVGLLGNWHGVIESIEGHPPTQYFWFWDSSRVVGGVGPDYTINEFPYFSLMLGDLHPHVMALPATLMTVALGCAAALRPSKLVARWRSSDLGWLIVAAISAGVLFTINSWDFPTYLLFLASCVAVNAYVNDLTPDWWRAPVASIALLAGLSVALFVPFYLHFHSLAHGIGFVDTPTVPLEFLQVFGLFLGVAAMLLALYGFFLEPAGDEQESDIAGSRERDSSALEAGHARLLDPSYAVPAALILLLAVLGVRFHLWTLLLVLVFGTSALSMLQRVLNTEEPSRADAIALLMLAVACLVLSLTEIIYLKDSFDGSGLYRMNTVFKFYYQAWTLLALAAAYGAYRIWSMLRSHAAGRLAWVAVAVVAAGVVAGAYYTYEAPTTAAIGGTVNSLDGMAWMQTANPPDPGPGDYGAIRWLQSHASTKDVELEATGGEYTTRFARIATFSGLQTVMGWAGHEGQWHGADPEIGQRVADVNTIYTTTSTVTAKRLLHRYHVRYVIVGDSERTIKRASLAKFSSFMRVAYRSNGTLIYTW
jgi:YYY domain-containing protein